MDSFTKINLHITILPSFYLDSYVFVFVGHGPHIE